MATATHPSHGVRRGAVSPRGIAPTSVEVSPRQVLWWGRIVSGVTALAVGAVVFLGSAADGHARFQKPPGGVSLRGHKFPQGRSNGVRRDVVSPIRSLQSVPDPSPSDTSAVMDGAMSAEERAQKHNRRTMGTTQEAGRDKLSSTFAFVLCCFLACSVCDHFNMYLPLMWRFPISVLMFIAGGLIGISVCYTSHRDDHMNKGLDNLVHGIQDASHFDPHALLFVILPPLLYESASSMHWHVLRKVLPSALMLAVPGVLLNTLLTGCFVRVAFRVDSEHPSWESSWLLAAILSATDPVAVVSTLGALGAPQKLASLVEGESLLNDGSAVIAAYVFRDWVMGAEAPSSDKFCPGSPPTMSCAMHYFAQVALGGCGIGALVGIVLHIWLHLARSQHAVLLEITIVLTAVYGAFFVAEAVQTSGVLAVVMLGFMMSSGLAGRLSHEGRHAHNIILSQIGYVCNQVAFFAGGIISTRFLNSDSGSYDHTISDAVALAEVGSLYVIIHLTRAAVIILFWPFLTRWGYGLTWKEGVILVFGGLRGAVSLVMGLIVEHNEYIEAPIRQMIVFHTSGIVFLTLFINGSTIDGIYKRLRLYPPSPFRQTHTQKVLSKVETECWKADITGFALDWFFSDCHIRKILRCVPRFNYTQFDIADVPQASDIESVIHTLKSLDQDAHRFRESHLLRRNNFSSETNFKHQWQARKLASERHLMENISSCTGRASVKDHIWNVISRGSRRIDYSLADNVGTPGFYISARSLEAISSEDDNYTGFELKLLQLDHTVIIGFLTNHHTITPSVDSQVLGHMYGSIGFEISTNRIFYNGPSGNGVIESQQEVFAKAGEVVCVKVSRSSSHQTEIAFLLRQGSEQDGSTVDLARCNFGAFKLDELFPSIEFRSVELEQFSTDASLRKCLHDGEPVAIAEAASTPPGSVSGKSAAGTIHRNASSYAGEGAITSRWSNDSTDTKKRVMCCKVALSYEPQLASDHESVNELFHVLFNTVMHRYSDMHEHGILGDLALSWLSEAVCEALDCADREVNAARAADFKAFQAGMDGQASSYISAVPVISRMRTKFKQSCSGKSKLVSVFEPILVEYLSLESRISAASFWDLFPTTWERTRSLGYRSTRAKVETLWAFVEAHEGILRESPAMERFPDLVNCITSVIAEARFDLEILADIQPRRFFYSKHLLALRVVMNRRLEKLQKFTSEGWISSSDAEGLKKCLWERIEQVDQFFPSVRHGIGRHVNHFFSSSSRSLSQLNAWEDITLPETLRAPGQSRPTSDEAPQPPKQFLTRLIDLEASDLVSASPKTDASLTKGAPQSVRLIRVAIACVQGVLSPVDLAEQPGSLKEVQCVCAIPGKRQCKFQTSVAVVSENSVGCEPQFHELHVAAFEADDSLEFTILGPSPDKVLGKATLGCTDICHSGFEGQLRLTDAGFTNSEALLTVKVTMLCKAENSPECSCAFTEDTFCQRCGHVRREMQAPKQSSRVSNVVVPGTVPDSDSSTLSES